jgi:hemolysin D
VQQISVHTLGGVVESIKPLMVVVPEGALTVEAHVLNKDAGFVRRGQAVAVKLEAFSYTGYGTVPGHILTISRDAIQDSRAGPYYLARIALERTTMATKHGKVGLSPGLTTTNDIRIGSRSILSYLVSPLAELHAEAGREK